MGQVALHRPALRRCCRTTVVFVLLQAGLILASTFPVSAQGLGWFGGIFGGTQQPGSRGAPAYPGFRTAPNYAPPPSTGRGYGSGYGADQPAPRVRHRRHVPVVVQKEAPPPPKTDASVFVDVFGDAMGQVLANGLDDALSDRSDVAVYHDAQGSSGLVTSDYYDWPKRIEALLTREPQGPGNKPDAKGTQKGDPKATLDAKSPSGSPVDTSQGKKPQDDPDDAKIDVAVMMIGSNDRQAITEGGKTYPLLSDEWTAAYKKRVVAIDEAFQKRGIPLIWVGLPITRDGDFANDLAAFNDIFREAAAKTGAIYVDTWEAFSDDGGAFSAYGPDIDGQTVKLRTADGINFTHAGARKLAHFVEAHVRRALDGKTPPVELPTAAAPPASKPAVAAVVKPDIGPIESLNEPPSAASGELATIALPPSLPPQTSAPKGEGAPGDLVQTSLVKGVPQAPPRGRVDDFTWPAAAKSAGH